MSTRADLLHDPQIVAAVDDLKTMIREHYPTAIFETFYADDPEGVYLRAAVDVDDPDEVMDLVIDRMVEYELDQDLPVYVLPVWTDERNAAWVAQEMAKRQAR